MMEGRRLLVFFSSFFSFLVYLFALLKVLWQLSNRGLAVFYR
ncbi:hypothetical protein [Salinisphaera sp. G21_0]